MHTTVLLHLLNRTIKLSKIVDVELMAVATVVVVDVGLMVVAEDAGQFV